MFKVIIVAVDGSEASDRAVEIAADLASISGTALHILNVPQDETSAMVMSGVGGYVPLVPLPPNEELIEAGKQIIEKAKKYCIECGASNVETHLRSGNPAQHVLALADDVTADLIITGRRGLGGIASAMLGSTSHAILNGSKCSCLSVP